MPSMNINLPPIEIQDVEIKVEILAINQFSPLRLSFFKRLIWKWMRISWAYPKRCTVKLSLVDPEDKEIIWWDSVSLGEGETMQTQGLKRTVIVTMEQV